MVVTRFKCLKPRCKGILKNIVALMMGPTFECSKCETRFDIFGFEYGSDEMWNSGYYTRSRRRIKELDN
jgi:hypothetical protein